MSCRQIGPITIGDDDQGDVPALTLVHRRPFNRSMWRPERPAALNRALQHFLESAFGGVRTHV